MASKTDEKNQARLKREAAQAAAAAQAKRTRNLQLLGGVVFLAALVVVLVVVVTGGKKTGGGIGADKNASVAGIAETKTLLDGIQQEGLALGDPKAPVTILEFVDVQCPFCRAHQLDEQPKIIKEAVRTGKAKIRLEPIALSFMGEDSEAGRTVMLRLAAQNKAWNFANLFYFNQGTEQTGYVTDPFLQKLAVAAGGTKADATPRTASGEVAAQLKQIDQLSSDLAVSGTPSFAIGKSGDPLKSYKMITLAGSDSTADQIIKAVNDFPTKSGV